MILLLMMALQGPVPALQSEVSICKMKLLTFSTENYENRTQIDDRRIAVVKWLEMLDGNLKQIREGKEVEGALWATTAYTSLLPELATFYEMLTEEDSRELARCTEVMKKWSPVNEANFATARAIDEALADIDESDATATEPTIIYGTSDDLKGLTRLFIDTEGDLESRKEIEGHVARQLKGVTFESSAAAAEIILEFEGGIRHVQGMHKVRWGEGYIYLPHPNGFLLIESYNLEPESFRVGWHPQEGFAKKFVDAYLKANPSARK